MEVIEEELQKASLEATNIKDKDERMKTVTKIDNELVTIKEKKDKVNRTLNTLKKCLQVQKITDNIATMGGKRRKKTKSKYNKRMSKRTRRKRGAGTSSGSSIWSSSTTSYQANTTINHPDNLIVGKIYKITLNGQESHREFVGEKYGLMGTCCWEFEPSFPLPIHFGSLEEDGWFDGTGVDDAPTDPDNIQHIPVEGFFMLNPNLQGRRLLKIETVQTAGRRRRRKRRTKRKKKNKRRRKYTKKKRRKRRKLN